MTATPIPYRPGEVVRDQDAGCDHDHRQRSRLHADGEAFDDVRRMPCLRRLGDRLHGMPARAGVVLGDRDQQERDDQTDDCRHVEVGEAVDPAVEAHRDRDEPDRREHRRDEHRLVQRVDHRVLAAAEPREEGADHGGHGRDAADREREQIEALVGEPGGCAEQHHGNRRDRVRLEQVRGHAGAVTDVVPDVVGDHRRVARVVLGDAGLDLPDEVGAHVGSLGEDAAAEPGEHGDERATEREADQVVDRGLRRVAEGAGQEPVVPGDAEQPEADDEQAGHRAGAEGDVQGGLQPTAGRLGRPAVRAHGDVHADEAGSRRQHRPDQEAERRAPAELVVEAEDEERHDRDERDRRVLLPQVGRSAFLDGARDLPHPLVSGRLLEQPPGQIEPVPNGHGSADQADEHSVMHEPIHPVYSLTKSSAEGLRRGRLCTTKSCSGGACERRYLIGSPALTCSA